MSDWQQHWYTSINGRDTYHILNKVDSEFISKNKIMTYFLSGYVSFPAFLFKIKKRSSDKYDCGEIGSVFHYLFGRCQLTSLIFAFDRTKTVRENMKRVIFCKANYKKLCEIYNVLNLHYSFIKYRF